MVRLDLFSTQGPKVDVSERPILAQSKEGFANIQSCCRIVVTASRGNKVFFTRGDPRPNDHLIN